MSEKVFQGEILNNGEKLHLDLIDKKLLVLLSKNARYSNTSLAKALNVSREVVSYRIKRLTELDFLHGFFTLIDVSKLGYLQHVLYLKLSGVRSYSSFESDLLSIPQISRIKLVAGSYDLQLVITSGSLKQFDETFNLVLSLLDTHLKDFVVLQVLEEGFPGMNVLLHKTARSSLKVKEVKGSSFQKEFKQQKKSSSEIISLDDMDRNLLTLLHHDARLPIRSLAKEVSLSPIAVENRLKNLISKGVIESMYPLFAISRLGFQWYKVLFRVKNSEENKFLGFLLNHDNVLWYMKLIGKWNYQCSVFAKSNADFYEILDDIRTKFSDDLLSYESIMVLEQKKFEQKF